MSNRPTSPLHRRDPGGGREREVLALGLPDTIDGLAFCAEPLTASSKTNSKFLPSSETTQQSRMTISQRKRWLREKKRMAFANLAFWTSKKEGTLGVVIGAGSGKRPKNKILLTGLHRPSKVEVVGWPPRLYILEEGDEDFENVKVAIENHDDINAVESRESNDIENVQEEENDNEIVQGEDNCNDKDTVLVEDNILDTPIAPSKKEYEFRLQPAKNGRLSMYDYKEKKHIILIDNLHRPRGFNISTSRDIFIAETELFLPAEDDIENDEVPENKKEKEEEEEGGGSKEKEDSLSSPCPSSSDSKLSEVSKIISNCAQVSRNAAQFASIYTDKVITVVEAAAKGKTNTINMSSQAAMCALAASVDASNIADQALDDVRLLWMAQCHANGIAAAREDVFNVMRLHVSDEKNKEKNKEINNECNEEKNNEKNNEKTSEGETSEKNTEDENTETFDEKNYIIDLTFDDDGSVSSSSVVQVAKNAAAAVGCNLFPNMVEIVASIVSAELIGKQIAKTEYSVNNIETILIAQKNVKQAAEKVGLSHEDAESCANEVVSQIALNATSFLEMKKIIENIGKDRNERVLKSLLSMKDAEEILNKYKDSKDFESNVNLEKSRSIVNDGKEIKSKVYNSVSSQFEKLFAKEENKMKEMFSSSTISDAVELAFQNGLIEVFHQLQMLDSEDAEAYRGKIPLNCQSQQSSEEKVPCTNHQFQVENEEIKRRLELSKLWKKRVTKRNMWRSKLDEEFKIDMEQYTIEQNEICTAIQEWQNAWTKGDELEEATIPKWVYVAIEMAREKDENEDETFTENSKLHCDAQIDKLCSIAVASHIAKKAADDAAILSLQAENVEFSWISCKDVKVSVINSNDIELFIHEKLDAIEKYKVYSTTRNCRSNGDEIESIVKDWDKRMEKMLQMKRNLNETESNGVDKEDDDNDVKNNLDLLDALQEEERNFYIEPICDWNDLQLSFLYGGDFGEAWSKEDNRFDLVESIRLVELRKELYFHTIETGAFYYASYANQNENISFHNFCIGLAIVGQGYYSMSLTAEEEEDNFEKQIFSQVQHLTEVEVQSLFHYFVEENSNSSISFSYLQSKLENEFGKLENSTQNVKLHLSPIALIGATYNGRIPDIDSGELDHIEESRLRQLRYELYVHAILSDQLYFTCNVKNQNLLNFSTFCRGLAACGFFLYNKQIEEKDDDATASRRPSYASNVSSTFAESLHSIETFEEKYLYPTEDELHALFSYFDESDHYEIPWHAIIDELEDEFGEKTKEKTNLLQQRKSFWSFHRAKQEEKIRRDIYEKEKNANDGNTENTENTEEDYLSIFTENVNENLENLEDGDLADICISQYHGRFLLLLAYRVDRTIPGSGRNRLEVYEIRQRRTAIKKIWEMENDTVPPHLLQYLSDFSIDDLINFPRVHQHLLLPFAPYMISNGPDSDALLLAGKGGIVWTRFSLHEKQDFFEEVNDEISENENISESEKKNKNFQHSPLFVIRHNPACAVSWRRIRNASGVPPSFGNGEKKGSGVELLTKRKGKLIVENGISTRGQDRLYIGSFDLSEESDLSKFQNKLYQNQIENRNDTIHNVNDNEKKIDDGIEFANQNNECPKTEERIPPINKTNNLGVVVRCRPLLDNERARGERVAVTCPNTDKVVVEHPDYHERKVYNFDRVYGSKDTQKIIFDESIAPLISRALRGENCCVLAYGQTGAGKTFTMEGRQGDIGNRESSDMGMIARGLYKLFSEMEKREKMETIEISHLEIYNEEIFDLGGKGKTLKKLKNIFSKNEVKGLIHTPILTPDEFFEILDKSLKKRRTAKTEMNERSSRSHSICTIHINQGSVSFVDLAGSENIKRSKATGMTKTEAQNINKSLLAIGRVIKALLEKASHIPFRDSILTSILQNSLGGKSISTIILNVSPQESDVIETLSTLSYAALAKSIENEKEKIETIQDVELAGRLRRSNQNFEDTISVSNSNYSSPRLTSRSRGSEDRNGNKYESEVPRKNGKPNFLISKNLNKREVLSGTAKDWVESLLLNSYFQLKPRAKQVLKEIFNGFGQVRLGGEEILNLHLSLISVQSNSNVQTTKSNIKKSKKKSNNEEDEHKQRPQVSDFCTEPSTVRLSLQSFEAFFTNFAREFPLAALQFLEQKGYSTSLVKRVGNYKTKVRKTKKRRKGTPGNKQDEKLLEKVKTENLVKKFALSSFKAKSGNSRSLREAIRRATAKVAESKKLQAEMDHDFARNEEIKTFQKPNISIWNFVENLNGTKKKRNRPQSALVRGSGFDAVRVLSKEKKLRRVRPQTAKGRL
eukprot:g5533.t1